ncbi:AMIN domain-containing protein, partial [Paracidovorax citrulli]
MSEDASPLLHPPAASLPPPHGPSRRGLLRAGSLVLLLGSAQIARGASIVAVRVWPAQDYSRVTIESDKQLSAKQFFVATPPRLAVDIEGIDLNPELRELVAKVKPDDPNIAGIRVGQNAPGVVRLVVDLKRAALPQVFTLPPIAAYRHRLVFDLYPAEPEDPLETLIAERLRDAAPGAASAGAPVPAPAPLPNIAAARPGTAGDPLGDLIAQHNQPAGKAAPPSPGGLPSAAPGPTAPVAT